METCTYILDWPEPPAPLGRCGRFARYRTMNRLTGETGYACPEHIDTGLLGDEFFDEFFDMYEGVKQ